MTPQAAHATVRRHNATCVNADVAGRPA